MVILRYIYYKLLKIFFLRVLIFEIYFVDRNIKFLKERLIEFLML